MHKIGLLLILTGVSLLLKGLVTVKIAQFSVLAKNRGDEETTVPETDSLYQLGSQLVAAIDGNQQPQNEDEQIDVSQIHGQSGRQVLLIAISARQNEEIYNSRSCKQKNTNPRNANF